MALPNITKHRWAGCLQDHRDYLTEYLHMENNSLIDACLSKKVIHFRQYQDIRSGTKNYEKAGKLCDILHGIDRKYYLPFLQILDELQGDIANSLRQSLGTIHIQNNGTEHIPQGTNTQKEIHSDGPVDILPLRLTPDRGPLPETNYNWPAPRCLVETIEGKGLRVNEETIKMLRNVRVPVNSIAIVGPYRTGKSYLMNQLARRKPGFETGSTVQGKTKGIWVWCLPHPSNNNTCLLLLDSEGLSDPERGDRDHDNRILSLTLLLSNTFVYNSMGTIDQYALDKLFFVTQISNLVKVRAGSQNEDGKFDGYLPNFVWAVRDFRLELEIDGCPCEADDYMENALKIKKGVSPSTSKYNLPRKALKHYFGTRKCFLLPPPLKDMECVSNIDSISELLLTQNFVTAVKHFTEYVIDTNRIKCIHGSAITGSALARLCEIYVAAIQHGAIPCIENAVDTMAESENTKAMEEAFQLYRTEIRKIRFPTDTQEQLSKHHQTCEKKTITFFLASSIFDKDHHYHTQLASLVHSEYQKVLQENEQKSLLKCQEVLKQLYGKIKDNLKAGVYVKKGGFEAYKNDMDMLQEEYNKSPGKGIKAAEQLMTFMTEKSPEFDNILKADKRLSEEQRKSQEANRQKKEAKRLETAARIEKERAERLLRDHKRSNDEHLDQVKRKNKAMLDKLIKDQQEQLDAKQKECEELAKNGFKEEAEELRKEINDIKKSRDENQKMADSIAKFVGKIDKFFRRVGSLFK